MIASAQTIRILKPIEPFCERTTIRGMSYGLSAASYDVRIHQTIHLFPGDFRLASTMERFKMPLHVAGIVHDKSTWARRGICVQNTLIDPGWEGYLTLELTNHSDVDITIMEGDPIAQIMFHILDKPTEQPYRGKYQNQTEGPHPARQENTDGGLKTG